MHKEAKAAAEAERGNKATHRYIDYEYGETEVLPPSNDRAITLNIEVSTDVAPFSSGLVRSVSNARLTPPVMPCFFPFYQPTSSVARFTPMNSRDVFARDDAKSMHESSDRLIKRRIR